MVPKQSQECQPLLVRDHDPGLVDGRPAPLRIGQLILEVKEAPAKYARYVPDDARIGINDVKITKSEIIS